MKIAVYGKGGIGKSTISANVSAALAEKGLSVLQIGCDPKHDSTRLLLGGKIPVTALQYIKTVLPADRRSEDIVYRGYGNVACVEAGGPEPGVGCAGRGIITTFDLLDELGIRSSFFDITLYDVLGDVVCGGFAVPIRNEYADAVYIVTSGEFLSLYAANNILKGIRNFTEKGDRIAGIIFNARGGEEEDDRVKRFADAVALPVVIRIPRSSAFSLAEEEGCTLIEGYPDMPETGLFRELALHISSLRQSGSELLFPALPLQDDELERIVLLRNDTRPVNKYILSNQDTIADTCVSCSVKNKRPLIGCAFLGAVSVTTMVTDAATVMHCPRSCAMRNYDRLIRMEQRAAEYHDYPYNPDLKKKFVTTDLSDEDFIFGGEKKLHDALESTIKNGFKTIFIITACPPGIIGDDVDKVAGQIRELHPDIQIIPVFVDGNLTGDGVQGRMDAYRAIISLIKPGISQYHDRRVNIIGNYFFERDYQDKGKKNRFMRQRTFPRKGFDSNPWTISAIFDLFGITVNCHFLYRTDVNSLAHFNDACLNLLVTMNDTMAGIKKMLGAVSHVPFLQQPFPSGFHETKKWVTDLAAVFGEEEKAIQVISQAEPEYRKMIERIKPHLEGKTVLISTYPHNIDWICDIARDLGMVILRIGLGYSAFSEYFTTRYADTIPIIHDYTIQMRSEDILSLQPDLVLYDYPVLKADSRIKSTRIPYNPGFGFFAAVDHAEQWARLMQYGLTEGWKLDGEGII